VAYIRLALEVNVPIMVVACLTQSDGSYIIHASDFIWMQPQESIKTSLETNAERVLALVENFIQMDPYQWSMPYAVWPEALNEVNKL
jgi:lauroyl/myristoyl acyltransferase